MIILDFKSLSCFSSVCLPARITKEYIKKGLTAQKKSVVLLKNEIFDHKATLPLKKNIKIFADGFDKNIFKKYCKVTDNPKDADYIIVQLRTVFNGNQPSMISIDGANSKTKKIKQFKWISILSKK